MSPVARIAAFLELVRFSNWPTLLSDIVLGSVIAFFLMGLPAEPWTLIRHHYSVPWAQIGWAVVGLTCLYWGGMVLNAVVDVRLDATERPDRPVPSGRIPLRAAWLMAVTLLVCGVGVFCDTFPYEGLVALLVGLFCIDVTQRQPEKKGARLIRQLGFVWLLLGSLAVLARLAGTALNHGTDWRGFALALDVGLLALAIVLYNTVHTRARWSVGLLGLCRGLAVLIAGLSAADASAWPFTNTAMQWKLAPWVGSAPLIFAMVGVAAYISMVSLVARREVPSLMHDDREGREAPLFCPWCDHGLATPAPGHCPECGTDLVSRPPVRAGERLIGSPRSVFVAALLLTVMPTAVTAWSFTIAADRLPPWWLCVLVAVGLAVAFLTTVAAAARAAAVHPSRTPRAVAGMLAALPLGEGVMMTLLGAPIAGTFGVVWWLLARLLQRVKWASIGS